MKKHLLLALSVTFFAREAAAAQDCAAIKKLNTDHTVGTTDAPTVLYVTGSSALQPVFRALGPVLFAHGDMTIVYRSAGSCAGVSAVVSSVAIPQTGTNIYWDPNSADPNKEEKCDLTGDVAAGIGASDVFAQTCNPTSQGLPPNIGDFQGPIQSMTFAVNSGSDQQSISAAAAYLTFGFDKTPAPEDTAVAPWTDKNFFFIRNSGSGTQSMLGAAINVPAAKWFGLDQGGSSAVASKLSGLTDPGEIKKSIGILAADFGEGTPAFPNVRPLAYQHTGQRCGFKPDVQPKDKKNTREGRYAVWGPLHLFATQDAATKQAVNPQARQLISYLQGVTAPPNNLDLITTEVGVRIVPPCAMKVQRTTEMGPMTPFKPAVSCGCAFDKAAGLAPSCSTCSTSSDCKGSNQACNFGFCEQQ